MPLPHAIVRRDPREFVVEAGIAALTELLEQERAAVCGSRYEHRADHRAFRIGHVAGELMLAADDWLARLRR